jgi:hypothetical protein
VYGNLETASDPEEFRRRLTSLNDQVAETIKNTTAHPFHWTHRVAEDREETREHR